MSIDNQRRILADSQRASEWRTSSSDCCRTAVEEALKRVRDKAREMREAGPADMRDMIWFIDAELKQLEDK